MAVPSATSFTTFTELVSSTYRNHKEDCVDNVSNHNALFRKISERGNVEKEDGGLSITRNIDFTANTTYLRYSGYDELNIANSEVFSAVEFPWRQVAINVTASGYEIRVNSGRNRIINLVKTRIKNAMRSMANGLSQDFYSAGSLTNQMNGLQALVSDAGTGTVGGIVSGTFTFWKNIVQSAAAPLFGGAITPSATTIIAFMNQLWLALERGVDKVDMIISSDDYYTFYENALQVNQRYMDDKAEAAAGFSSLRFKSARVWRDSASSGIPAAHMYFLNTEYFKLVVHQDAWMDMMDEQRSINQDAIVIPILSQGNLIVTNRSLQGVAKA